MFQRTVVQKFDTKLVARAPSYQEVALTTKQQDSIPHNLPRVTAAHSTKSTYTKVLYKMYQTFRATNSEKARNRARLVICSL